MRITPDIARQHSRVAPTSPKARRERARARLVLLAGWLAALLLAVRPQALRAQSEPTAAQGAEQSAPPDCRRCLGGHRFLVSSFIPDPFITTHFRSGTGGGAATNLSIAVRDVQGEILDSIGGSLAFFTLDFEYQYAFNRWFAAHGIATATGRTGTNYESVLASGATALYGTNLGLTARVWSNDVAQVALTADAIRNKVWSVDPYRFAQALADEGYTEETKALLLRSVSVNRGVGGVRGAWAPRPWLGLNALVEAGVADDPRPDEGAKSVIDYGALAGVNLDPLWGAPLGLTLGYRGQSGPGRSSPVAGTASSYTMGVLYMGRSSYLIGVDATLSGIDVDEAGVSKIDATQVRLVTRFDF